MEERPVQSPTGVLRRTSHALHTFHDIGSFTVHKPTPVLHNGVHDAHDHLPRSWRFNIVLTVRSHPTPTHLHGHMTNPTPNRALPHTVIHKGAPSARPSTWPLLGQWVRLTTSRLCRSANAHVLKWVASPPARGEKRGYPVIHTRFPLQKRSTSGLRTTGQTKHTICCRGDGGVEGPGRTTAAHHASPLPLGVRALLIHMSELGEPTCYPGLRSVRDRDDP